MGLIRRNAVPAYNNRTHTTPYPRTHIPTHPHTHILLLTSAGLSYNQWLGDRNYLNEPNDNLIITPPFSEWENDRFHCRWKGIVFIRGTLAGAPSLEKFSRQAESEGIETAAAALSGMFFLAVLDKRRQRRYCLVDNTGLFQAFYSPSRVSTSFLRLARVEGLRADDLSPRSVVEFIHLGNVFFNRTFFDRVRKIDGDQILALEPAKEVQIREKRLPPLWGLPPKENLTEMMEATAQSLAERTIGIDLTGGFDSRLLALLCLQAGLRFETGVSGSNSHPDVTGSSSIAQRLGIKHTVADYSSDNLEPKLLEAFSASDALADPVPVMRTTELQLKRKAGGIDLALSAGGGEIFDDFFWLQDFPFYRSRRAHLQRLFKFRFRPLSPPHDLFDDRYRGISDGLVRAFTADLERFRRSTNTQTYDNIFIRCRWKENLGRSLTGFTRYIDYYAPYLEYDAMRIALALPLRDRIDTRAQKQLLESLDAEIAGMPLLTRNYMTLMKYSFLLGPARGFFLQTGQMLATASASKVRRFLIESAKTPGFEGKIQSLPSLSGYTEALHQTGILNQAVNLSSVKLPFLGRFISLGLLLDHLGR